MPEVIFLTPKEWVWPRSNAVVQSCPLAATFRLAHCPVCLSQMQGISSKSGCKEVANFLPISGTSPDSKFSCLFPEGKWCKSTSQLSSTELLPVEVLVEFGSDFSPDSPRPVLAASSSSASHRGQEHLNSLSNILFQM